MVEYKLKVYKTAINKMKYIDGWFWCRYTLNPYGGCEHACIYCDARSQKYYLHSEFEEIIFVKKNIDKVLEKQMKSAQKDVIAIGGVCDAYQPAENTYQNTRKCLKVIEKQGFPVNISTKSNLVLRDLDVLKSIAEKSWCTIAFTITTLDAEIERFLESGANTSQKRLEAIQTIKKNTNQINVGVNFMPIVPFLEDSKENLENVIREIKAYGADYVQFAPGMTLRDNQKINFMEKIHIKYPELVFKFNELYQQNMQANYQYVQEKNATLVELCKKFQLNIRLKRWIPNDYRQLNYKIAELLLNDSYINQIIGKSYTESQWAGLSINNLKKSILEYYNTGKLLQIENLTPQIMKSIQPYLKTKGTLEEYF